MIFLRCFFILLLSSVAQAAPQNVVIDSKVFLDGKKISSPRVTTLDGSKAFISQVAPNGKKRMHFEVRPVVLKNNQVRLHYTLLLKEKNNEIHSRGDVKLIGKKAKLIDIDNGKVKIQLKVNRT